MDLCYNKAYKSFCTQVKILSPHLASIFTKVTRQEDPLALGATLSALVSVTRLLENFNKIQKPSTSHFLVM